MDSKALKIAWQAHSTQKRKGTDIPYIVHPVEVGVILIENGAREEIISAGLLHDTLEDTEITEEFILREFGETVLELVKGASETDKLDKKNKANEKDEKSTWKQRKQHTIEYIRKEASFEVKLIACADKLSNARSMLNDYKKIGDLLWERFNNKNPMEHKWYYESILESLQELSEYGMYEELQCIIRELFEEKINKK